MHLIEMGYLMLYIIQGERQYIQFILLDDEFKTLPDMQDIINSYVQIASMDLGLSNNYRF
jgi:hypothetical protein